MINVLKRNGVKEPLNFSKIEKQTEPATKGLEGVSRSELEMDAKIIFVDGIKTSDIQTTLIKTAVDKIDIDRPNWTYVAARLYTYDIYHKVRYSTGGISLSKSIKKGQELGKYQEGIELLYDLDELDSYIDNDRDNQFTYLGIKMLFDRYLLKDDNNMPIETPQQLFMGVAMFLAQNEYNRMYWVKKFYDILSKFEVMSATPTLSNARTTHSQCSSCYIGSTPDSAEGILEALKEMALLSKFGGGIGWDWNAIRACLSKIDKYKEVAGGIIPFLKINNDLSIAFDQLGTRPGAIAIYIEPWHADVRDFIDLKKNSGEERRRTHELFPALWLNDLFMERVANDAPWTLFDPYDVRDLSELYGDDFKKRYEEYENDVNIRKTVISAKNLWKEILRSYAETGNPFLCFKDEANKRNPNKHAGVIRSSNLCTEIFQNTKQAEEVIRVYFDDGLDYQDFPDPKVKIETDEGLLKEPYKLCSTDHLSGKQVYCTEKLTVKGQTAVCNLMSVNLSKINTREDFERVIPIAVRMLDNVIELNFYPTKRVKDTNIRNRAIGLGVMGEAQMLAERSILFGTKEHFECIDEIMETFSYNVIKSSVELAKEKGSYPDFEGSDWSKGILPIDTANSEAMKLTNREYQEDWDSLREEVKTGIRNGYLMAIAPTSSISLLTGTTQAIEPVYKRKWFEENSSGLIPVTAPNISPTTWNFYINAYEVKQTDIIKAGAVRQKWLDQGQSLNIFVKPNEITGKTLNGIYTLAHRLGIKSTYYLRSQSPEAKQDVQDRSLECVGCQ